MSLFESKATVWSLVKVPAIITLAVTALRLAGELMGGNEFLFGRPEVGSTAAIGITWLVVIFGFWFGRRIQINQGGPGGWRVAGKVLIALAAVVGGIFGLMQQEWLVFPSKENPEFVGMSYFLGLMALGVVLAIMAWPRLGMTLLLYAFLARIPVVIVTWFAVNQSWGTHYDKAPDNIPPTEGTELFLILSTPQVTVWIAFTVIAGALFGALGAAMAGRSRKVTS